MGNRPVPGSPHAGVPVSAPPRQTPKNPAPWEYGAVPCASRCGICSYSRDDGGFRRRNRRCRLFRYGHQRSTPDKPPTSHPEYYPPPHTPPAPPPRQRYPLAVRPRFSDTSKAETPARGSLILDPVFV